MENRALSIKQPWAWLIVNGYKTVENRNWNTKFRGGFIVHAGKSFDKDGYEDVKSKFPEITMPEIKDFERGGVVGEVFLDHVIPQSQYSLLTSDDKKWFIGKYGFILSEAKRLPFQPCKGKLGFFTPMASEK